eukprot:7582004-Lingulodinium_polyedra.AAC.1
MALSASPSTSTLPMPGGSGLWRSSTRALVEGLAGLCSLPPSCRPQRLRTPSLSQTAPRWPDGGSP